MKFRVGDKVKILPCATSVGVAYEDVGKIGIVSETIPNPSNTYGIKVRMNEVCSKKGRRCLWSIGTAMIELSPTKGTQLLFNFME